MKRILGCVLSLIGLGGCSISETENLTAVGQGFVGLFNLAGDGVMRLVTWLTTGTLLVCLMFSGGCAEGPIKATDQLMQHNTTPLIQEVMKTQAVQNMLVQANAQAINPAIQISGHANYVQGVDWDVTVRADGCAANLQSTVSSVARKEIPTTQPVKTEEETKVK